MDRFLDVVKIDFSENIEKYFRDVEVESIKKSKTHNTLNFYLISQNLIPYMYKKATEEIMTSKLFNVDSAKQNTNDTNLNSPINLNIKYKLSDNYTAKAIYDEIRKDLFDELKDIRVLYAAFFRQDNIKFTDDDTMEITFVKAKEFKSVQDELVNTIKNIFENRYGKKINIKINLVDFEADQSFENRKSATYDDVKNTEVSEDNNKAPLVSKKSSVRDRNNGISKEGDILYGKAKRTKAKFVSIANILYDMDNIETKGVIYNLRLRKPQGKEFIIYSVFIYDGEACIEIKFFGNASDEDTFKLRFKIGTEIIVIGNAKYDTYSSSIIIGPRGISLIKVAGEREVIEFGHLGDEDYHNIIITDRTDDEKEKRVELHLHTKSSAQDGVGEVKAYIDTATKFGMTAMAITDHGCVNALADAYDYIEDKKRPRKNQKFKLIYGVEGYLVDDFENYYIDRDNNFSKKSHKINGDFVVFELATTGLNRKNDDIIKIEAVRVSDFAVTGNYEAFVKTNKPISVNIRDNTGIRESDLTNAGTLKDALSGLINFAKDSVLVTSSFNPNWMITDILKENGFDNDVAVLDLTTISRLVLPKLKRSDLVSIAKELKIKYEGLTDRKKGETKKVLTPKEKLILEGPILSAILRILNTDYAVNDISELRDKIKITDEFIRRLPYYHIILLAKNDVGRVNLYKLVSDSSIKYMYNKRPRMPRSLINKYREGLIIGSACIVGEFMNAVKNGASDDYLKNIAMYYDYLEIQPVLNNSFLLIEDKENFKSIKDLEDLNRKVIEIADEIGKLVVATCDCHYVEKSDKLFRTILRIGTSYKKTNVNAEGKLKVEIAEGLESSNAEELYFRTTKEMLDEFAYLGIDKAREVVITNTNKINNMIEEIIPKRLDKCPPHIEGSDEELKNSCYAKYEKIFGDTNIEEVKNRLDNELKYIIDNGYSVMYIAAKKLIDYSVENGYPVGSRGSVGSSFVATLIGVSEVNPLKPYYRCPKCNHIEYDTEETRKYENDTGFDMPDKNCPVCNTKMLKDGVNIPFETFLGIPGDKAAHKEPDIDLNFCSVYQSSIHRKTVDLFGEANTFKAGTVGTVAPKTAYAYVEKYAKQEKKSLTHEQINYYVGKILDCKNNTGQHPGGMVVLPKGEEIYTFTPIQLAADKEGNGITTHFDYHKIDKNLLKLDLLGHDSPLILKKLGELTGTNFLEVPFYEEEVLRLFKNTSSLGITSNDISGTKLGCLTIPEFGTDFAMGMCEEAKPKTVADLIRIAGLAHGTDVWQGNVQELIRNGDCELNSAICCRDDIMIYLIDKGLDMGLAFNIMESVRKGKGLKAEWVDEMKAHDVPDWYIGCCKKIKYMFPKAHAAAYVLASLRIAYYKVHYPKEYYAVYFSVKKDGIDYKLMMQSKEDITYHIAKIKRIINEKSSDSDFKKKMSEQEKTENVSEKKIINDIDDVSDEEKLDDETLTYKKYEEMSAKNLYDLYMVYRVVEEMKARGIDFCPIDIYKAKCSDFQVIDGKIMPSFDSIPGVGTKDIDIDYNNNIPESEKSTAMKCEIEGNKGEYSSIENFANRTGVNKTVLETMKKLDLFKGMKEEEQNTVFDYL
ncbi:MAG: PolC-type DNA polymerase III [Lachnospiraceae bacterium]|nr:PolC-type DNA polymerase III [Lachnospiraceae bacterium]